MPTIVCDKCENRFEPGPDTAGTTVYCPKCGAPNGVPATPATSPAAGQAPGGTTDSERMLLRLRPAMFRARPALFTLLLSLFLGGLAGAIWLLAQSGQMAWVIACAAASMLGLIPLLAWRIRKLGTALEVTSKRTILYRGLLSKASSEVMHSEISNFQIKQSFLNRVFRVGTIGISSSGQEGIEIVAPDIPSPYRVRELIDSYRNMGRATA